MSRRPHQPTRATRDTVQMHTLVGTAQGDVARVLGIDEKTLRKHYRDELDLSKARANAIIGGALFNKARGGDTTAMIFWMKTQAKWAERHELDHSSTDGSMTPKPALDTSKLSTQALQELMAARESESK